MMDTSDATLAMAASVTERARDLIDDGWVKGTFYQFDDNGSIKVPTKFCIMGALKLAAMELFEGAFHAETDGEVIEIATCFILDEVRTLGVGTYATVPSFNDASARTHEQVLAVLDGAARRLWDLSISNGELESEGLHDLSRYVDVEPSEPTRQYLELVLA